jgi:prepilin-type processing-associated H-X9-DG protein
MKTRLVSRRTEGAIRRIDVAVSIAGILVLVALAVLYAGRWRERVLRARCGANLKQIGLALQMYSRDYKGLLPDVSQDNPQLAGPTWPWDMNTNLTDILIAKGATRAMFYCPANPKMNDDRHWNFWKQVDGPVRVTGYGMLFQGIRQVPPRLWCADLSAKNGKSAADTELGFDTTACVNNDYSAITGLLVDPSNHVRGKKPLGGNILFLDGHVRWRDFSEMKVRFNTIGPAGPVLWSY